MSNKYEMKDIGFPGVQLQNGFSFSSDDDGDYVEYHNISGLLQAVTRTLCSCDIDLTGIMIRFLRERLKLSQTEFGKLIRLSDRQMVSSWERGRRPVPKDSQELIKLKVRARTDCNVSIGVAEKKLCINAPDSLEFVFELGQWKWANDPVAIASPEFIQRIPVNSKVSHFSMSFFDGTTEEQPWIEMPETKVHGNRAASQHYTSKSEAQSTPELKGEVMLCQ